MQLDEPLNDKEFKELDRFLMSDRCSDECMTLDALHGFLTANVIGPETVSMSLWLPRVWGPSPKDEPRFRSRQERDRILQLITRFNNEIALTFAVAARDFEPLFSQFEQDGEQFIDGEAWAWGFWEGMQMHKVAWDAAWQDPAIAPLLRPFYLLGAEEVEEEELAEADTPAKVQRLSLEIEAALPAIQRYWQTKRQAAAGAGKAAPAGPKAGRNEDCPCGSGKKFKRCCGAH